MKKFIILIIFIVLLALLYVKINYDYNNNKINEKKNNIKNIIKNSIKKSTPDFIRLDTPKDKSFKNFCIKCKQNLNDLSTDYNTQRFLISGACSSCNTPNIPM
jgi:hypothetical protein